MKFVLGCIISFDVKSAGTSNNYDEYPYIPRWYFSTCVIFKTLVTQNRYLLPLIHTAKEKYGIHTRRKKIINFMLPI